MPRPSASKKYPHVLPIHLILNKNIRAGHCRVTDRGYPSIWYPELAGKEVTVLIGYKYGNGKIKINPDDEVYTCKVGSKGDISSVGKHNAGKECTIIFEEYRQFEDDENDSHDITSDN
jgi:hypothetical protein